VIRVKRLIMLLAVLVPSLRFIAFPLPAGSRIGSPELGQHRTSFFCITQVQPPETKVTGTPRKIIDLLPAASAPTTQWSNGNVWLPFAGEDTDARGFACYRENAELEDGNTYSKVLQTHPEWRNEYGLIVGIFKIVKLPAKATFRSQVGFLKGATQTDGVKFRVYTKKDPSFDAAAWCYHDGRLDAIGLYLDRYAGQDVELVLEVHVYHTSSQDWAVWVSPRIEWE
jgi:hypothetical protein